MTFDCKVLDTNHQLPFVQLFMVARHVGGFYFRVQNIKSSKHCFFESNSGMSYFSI